MPIAATAREAFSTARARGFEIGVSTLRPVYIAGETFDATVAVRDPAGKPVGTALKFEVFEMTSALRGLPADYDSWAYSGAPGWSYEDVLPFFVKSEDYEGGASEHHGVGGPLAVSNVSEPHPLCEAFIEATQQAGHPRDPAQPRLSGHQRHGLDPGVAAEA